MPPRKVFSVPPRPPRPALERDVKKAILESARARGVWIESLHGSARQRGGLPDLFGCYHGVLLALEIKRDHRAAAARTPSSIRQRRVLREIRAAGGVATVVWEVAQVLALLDALDALDASPGGTRTYASLTSPGDRYRDADD